MRDEREHGLFSAVVSVAAGLELGSTLRRIVMAATELVDARYGALGVIDPDGSGLSEFIHVGMDHAVADGIDHHPRGEGILGLLVEHPVPIRLDDLSSHPSSVGFPSGHPAMRSFLGVPVRVRGEAFGNLYLSDKLGGGSFTSEDERTVMALAAAAAVAIENARLYESTRQKQRWQSALTDVADAVLQEQPTRDVLALIAERARSVLDADISLVVLGDDASSLTTAIVDTDATGRDADFYVGRPILEHSLIGDVYRSGEGTVSREGTASLADVDMHGPVVAVPLGAADDVLGVLVLLWAEPRHLPADVLTQADSFASQAAVSLVLASARREHERLAVYEDRDRIARDLHDLVIQRLFATGMLLQGTTRLDQVPEGVVERVERAVDELDETIKEIRQTIFALHEPVDGPTSSTRGRVLRETAQSASLLGFEPAVRFVGPVDSVVTPAVADHVIAALREALTNAAKHAQARRVEVMLQADAQALELRVTDDGVGVPVDGSGRRSGVANLAERARELGGQCTVERVSSAGGTRLVWRAPLTSLS